MNEIFSDYPTSNCNFYILISYFHINNPRRHSSTIPNNKIMKIKIINKRSFINNKNLFKGNFNNKDNSISKTKNTITIRKNRKEKGFRD